MKTVVAVYPDPVRPEEFIIFYSDGSMRGLKSFDHTTELVSYDRGRSNSQ